MGTPIRVVHQPNKVGIEHNQIFLEAHVPISDTQYLGYDSLDNAIQKASSSMGMKMNVKWRAAQDLRRKASGYPEAIGTTR